MKRDLPALPATLALVDDDATFSEVLRDHFIANGVRAEWFADSEALLCSAQPFDFDFYLLDLSLPGVDGLSLLRLLRRRSCSGVLVVSGQQAESAFGEVVAAGADMFIAKPVSMAQLLLAVAAIHRRSGTAPRTPLATWRLDPAAGQLIAPGGVAVALSATDLRVLDQLQRAKAHLATREQLVAAIGLPEGDANLLNATLYRLRRRIEVATHTRSPLQSRQRMGYQFTAPLQRA